MKCKIPEISWHNRDPVLSVDIQPKTSSTNIYRLASGGTDAHVLIWYMKLTSGEHGDIELDLAADLTRHQRAVNAVKWSPNGELLASGDDESVVFIWKQKSDNEPINILDPTNEQDKEVWITLKVLRGHMEDIYDLSWSPNSLFLVSGSVDNSAMVWDVQKGKSLAILSDHKGFVQGVAWDPKNQYIATLSTDRYLRIFDIQTKKVLHRIRKGTLPVPEDNALHGKTMHLFHDDTLQTFFRRLSFTPDGKLLLTPAGVTDYEGCTQPLHATYVFSRYGFRQPAIILPCPEQYTVAVRCSPILYSLRPHDQEKNPPVVPLPYRMIFAVATKSCVYFYDTQQKQPFALISNIHYTRLTDITWSNDGRIVVVSSTDGFCSLITFEEGELGEVYKDSDAVLEAALAQVIAKNSKTKKSKDNDNRSRKPSMDENSQSKEVGTQAQKEASLEKIVEKDNAIEASTGVNKTEETSEATTKENNESTEVSNDTPKATPIAIKRKPVLETKVNKEKEITKATPIAIKRKPGPIDNSDKNTPTPIAIKRKPGPVETKPSENVDEKSDTTENLNTEENTPPKATKPVIILDKEILGTDEKFESPEKKCRPATPISVRRHPRTPSNTQQTPTQSAAQSPTTFSKVLHPQSEQTTPSSSLQKPIKTPQREKKPTPIAVRKTPRSIPVVNTPTLVEEALDAWPVNKDALNTSPTIETDTLNSQKTVKESGVTPLPSEETFDRTEDICLVYEETVEEAPAPPVISTSTTSILVKQTSVSEESSSKIENKSDVAANPATPSNKTPRRVALKTISTPKSKKKLLD
ncbi:chromatin assembly factor 1 subunit B [Stomoxys calcitrans]|uniref:chromatin assembly factor 1 subunit B n=1 Tax=Stomoxys calcitrans TaxID=35570 RepID=UPI0027E28269|nr:chromatin assembly factor 1 subunit B [Stomoxys calcitrans]